MGKGKNTVHPDRPALLAQHTELGCYRYMLLPEKKAKVQIGGSFALKLTGWAQAQYIA